MREDGDQLGIGGGLRVGEIGVGCEQEQLGQPAGGELGREREAIMQQGADGEEPDARVGFNRGEDIEARGVEHDRGGLEMAGGKGEREGAADARADGEEEVFTDVALADEVDPGGLGVGLHGGLAEVDGRTRAEAAIVDGEDRAAERAQGLEGGGRVDERAIARGEIEEHEMAEAAGLDGGHPPGGSLRQTGGVRAKADEVEGPTGDGGGPGFGTNRMQDHLPLPLIEEQTQGGVAAEQSDDQDRGSGTQQPACVDDLWRTRLRGARAGCRTGWCRLRHRFRWVLSASRPREGNSAPCPLDYVSGRAAGVCAVQPIRIAQRREEAYGALGYVMPG